MEKSRKDCTGWDFRMLLLAVLTEWSHYRGDNVQAFGRDEKNLAVITRCPYGRDVLYALRDVLSAVLFRAVLFQDLEPDTVLSVSIMIPQLSLYLSSLVFYS